MISQVLKPVGPSVLSLACSLVYLHCFHLEIFVFFFVRGSNGSDDVVLYKTMGWSIARFSAFA